LKIFFWDFLALSSFGNFFIFGKKGYSFWNERQEKAFYFDPNPNQYFKRQGHHNPAFSVLPTYSGLGF